MTGVGDTLHPTWRGRIHRVAAAIAVPLFLGLVVAAPSPTARLACAVYGICVTTMLAVSAAYHAEGISPVRRRRLRRVDHSTILLAIAGSYTAVTTLALDGAPERRLLTVVWIAAAIGIAVRMTWLHAPYPVVAIVYVQVGWCALIELDPLLESLGTLDTALVAGGGVVYTAGAVVYALRRPDPAPAVFGYHEVFHALVTLAAAMHYAAVVHLVAGR